MFEKVFNRKKPVGQSMDFEVDRYLEDLTPKRPYMQKAERNTLFKAYLADKQGEEITLSEIAKDMRVSPAQASRILTSLISSKEIVRKGSKNHYSYFVSTPEVQRVERRKRSDVKERVLSFLAQHQMDELLTQEEIARGSGVTQPQASTAIKELVEEGTVVRSEPTREGTRYMVNDSPNAHLRTEEELQRSRSEETAKQNRQLAVAIEPIIWTFIRQTRVTDVFAFLTWLENGGNPINRGQ